MPRRIVFALLLPLTLCPSVPAQGLEYVKAHYTKYEYRIPMRDGVKLFIAVYVPKDDSQTYPILLNRTPYSVRPYGVDQYPNDLYPGALFAKAGYIFAYQDVRGRNMSEGEFVNMRPYIPNKHGPKDVDETSDTFDTIDWLIKNVRNHNGKVGQMGISYPGFYTAAGMIDAHPALRAASPQAPVTDWFVGDDFHHNGALFLPHCFNFMANFGKPRPEPTKRPPGQRFDHGTPDGYDFFLNMGPLPTADAKYLKGDIAFWKEAMKHGTYDEFWQARNLRQHLKNIKPAVMTVGGWFDAENLFGALETFKKVEANHPPAANHLVMGPWVHGGWSRGAGDALGPVRFNAKTGDYYRETIELPFFEYHLKGVGDGKHPKAWAFETGTNQWRKFDAWPPNGEKKALYFHANGRLSFDPPSRAGEACDEYLSDPAKPVPYYDRIGIGMDQRYMTADQRFAARRPDVLVYESDVLDQDVTIAGPIVADLVVSTSGTDSDWIVKLIDVYPDDLPNPETDNAGGNRNQNRNPTPSDDKLGGYQQLVRGDVMRGKFRSSYEKPEAFKPGEPSAVKFALNDVCHTFRPGHKIMVQVQSTWFPLVDRNPQTFCDIYSAKAEDFQKATQRVYRSGEQASRVAVTVVK
jgi:putative CocE/NonD family hydrolase